MNVDHPAFPPFKADLPSQVTRKQFKRFLVDSPLVHVKPGERPPGACPPTGFGTFQQQYWLDGEQPSSFLHFTPPPVYLALLQLSPSVAGHPSNQIAGYCIRT